MGTTGICALCRRVGKRRFFREDLIKYTPEHAETDFASSSVCCISETGLHIGDDEERLLDCIEKSTSEVTG